MAFPASRVKPIDPQTGDWTPEWRDFLWRLFGKTDQTLTPNGQITASTPVVGRTEGIGTTITGLSATGDIKAATKIVGRTEGVGATVGQLNSAGQLISTDQIAADGTGSPLTGGKRAAVALDTNNRLVGSGRNNPVNVAFVPQSSTVLSNDGVSATVSVASFSVVYGDGTVTYNAGSFDPGSFGTWYAWITDPTFAGGVPNIVFSASPNNQANANGNIPLGKIATANGVVKTGGGTTGGTTPGGGGGRGYVQ